MGRDHFAQYAKNQPEEYQAFSNSVWNTFVGVTHTVGLGKFFTFTPDFEDKKNFTPSDGQFPDDQVCQSC